MPKETHLFGGTSAILRSAGWGLLRVRLGDPSSFESSMPNTRGIPVHVPVDLLNHDYVPLVFRIRLL